MSSIAARNLLQNNRTNNPDHLPQISRGGSSRPGTRSGAEGVKAQKPQLLVCYLCGQQFGTSSLQIHMPQCFNKKTIEWERAEPGKRGPRPRDPSTVDLSAMPKDRDEFNNQQFSNFTENLAQCPNCGRKFLADRLEVHLRSCKAGSAGASKPIKGKEFSGGGGQRGSSASPGARGGGGGGGSSRFNNSNNDEDEEDSPNRRPKGQKPMFLVCYLCGQQFGTSSLEIHMPQCFNKKTIEWERAEPGKRGPRPRDPSTVDLSAMPKNREEFNNQQFSNFTENLAQCPNCGRKFLADRLEVHLRSCKAGSAGASKPIKGKDRPSTSSSSPSSRSPTSRFGKYEPTRDEEDQEDSPNRREKGQKPMFLVCYLCGQQFGTSSLQIHLPQCYVKKMIVWERGDPSTRGPRPKDPATVDLSAMPKNKEEFNNQQFSNFTENLSPCPNCGRKFIADRLEVHLRSCKAGSAGASKPVNKQQQQAPSSQQQHHASSARPASTGGMGGGGGGGGGSGGFKFQQAPSSSSNQNTNNNNNSSNPPVRLPPKLRALKKLLVDEMNEAGKTGDTIELDELYNIVREIDPGVSDADADLVMDSLDENNDGVIDSKEWAKAVKETGSTPTSKKPSSTNNNTQQHSSSVDPLRNRLPSSSSSPSSKSSGNNKNDKKPSMMFCDSCGEKIPSSSQFCPSCQADLGDINDDGEGEEDNNYDQNENENTGGGGGAASLGKLCNECGEVFSEEAQFCEECGGQLESLVPAQHSASVLKNSNKQHQNYDDENDDDYNENSNNSQYRPTPPPDSHQRHSSSGGAPPHRKFQSSSSSTSNNKNNNNANPAASYNSANFNEEEEAPPEDMDMTRVECSICGRKFAPESIAKHERVCQKVSSKQRRVFDSSKMRQVEEMKHIPTSSSTRNNNNNRNQSNKPKEVPKWKRDSMQFRNAMKQAREVGDILAKGGTAKDLPPPTYSENSHYVPCPHCGRRFAPDTAERHIPKCSQTMNRPKPPPRRR